MASFIGLENVQAVARVLEPNIVTGPAWTMADELERLGIKVETGIQNQKIYTVFAGKGGETRRKKVGDVKESKLGYFFERVLQTEICVHRIRVNEDYFKEKPAVVEINGSAATTFPLTEFFMKEQAKLFGKDVFNCAINGKKTAEGEKLGMFDGFNEKITQDINAGVINQTAKNLVPTGPFDKVVNEGDFDAYNDWVEFEKGWSADLKDELVYVWLPVDIALNIKDAYEQKHRSHQAATELPNGNFTLGAHPKRIFCPFDRMKGTRIVAFKEGTMILGVDNEGDKSFVNVVPEPSHDTKDMVFQIQSLFGVVVKDPSARAFVTNGGVDEGVFESGDYQADAVTVTANNVDLGTVSIKKTDNTPVENGTEVEPGTTLVLTATPKADATFKKWSNGATTTTINIVTTGDPMYFTAIFESTSSSSD